MAGPADDFQRSLDARVSDILRDCTRCGACVEACPTPRLDAGAAPDAAAIAGGVLDILRRGDTGHAASRRWASDCCGTGSCLAVCEHGINPRFMLLMARRALARARDAETRRSEGRSAFQRMSRGVRTLSRLQLPPALLARLSPSSHPRRDGLPDLVFYTGCNLLKTPHIGLLCLDVLDRLGASYEVHGGPSSCCGILQMRPGDTGNAGRQGYRTVERLAGAGASQVLSWCPTCQIHFGETVLPSYGAAHGPAFQMTLFPVYLAQRLDALAPLMTRPVPRRVAVYRFPGAPGAAEAVHALLQRVPALDLVDLPVEPLGYQLSSLSTLPAHRDRSLARALRAAEAAGVDALVDVFHGDHRELVGHQGQWPFEIVNYMELVGASMGISRDDTFKRLKLMGDADTILAQCAPLLEAHGLDAEQAREVILEDLLGDQLLAPERALHPA